MHYSTCVCVFLARLTHNADPFYKLLCYTLRSLCSSNCSSRVPETASMNFRFVTQAPLRFLTIFQPAFFLLHFRFFFSLCCSCWCCCRLLGLAAIYIPAFICLVLHWRCCCCFKRHCCLCVPSTLPALVQRHEKYSFACLPVVAARYHRRAK